MRDQDAINLLNFLESNGVKKEIYLDIGACVGELSFPFANIFKAIYSFEPNTEAIKIFNEKNDYDNVILIDKALGDSDEEVMFGGFGGLKRYNQPGVRRFDDINEMNTLLVNDDKFMNNKIPNPLNLPMPKHDSGDLIKIKSVTLDTFMSENGLSYDQISFIKMDIEGGEKLVIPNIVDKLDEYKIPLYLELHTHVLSSDVCIGILEKLFKIYDSVFDREFRSIKFDSISNRIKKGCGTVQLFFNHK
jgi:FkbM family methyltransferase